MRFQVPQYIDVEDKIFGPLTVKQFIYVVGSAGVVFVLYSFLPFVLAILLGMPVAAIGGTLAFYKVNDRPFIEILEAAFHYISRRHLYVWRKQDRKIKPKEEKAGEAVDGLFVPKLSDSKLKDLSWSLDIQENISLNRQRSDGNLS